MNVFRITHRDLIAQIDQLDRRSRLPRRSRSRTVAELRGILCRVEWQICGIGLGPVPRSSGPFSRARSVPHRDRWAAAQEGIDAATRALAGPDPAALESMLAPAVQLQERAVGRRDAVRELLAWRCGWQICDVLFAETLVSGGLCAASGFVFGIEQAGTPSCQPIHITLSVR